MSESDRSQKYQQAKTRLFYVSLSIDIIVLVGLQLSGLSLAWREIASGFSSSLFLVNALYLAIFCLVLYLIHFPLNFFLGFTWEHRFGLSTQTLRAWLTDEFKKAGLSFLFGLVLVEIIYFLLRQFPQTWWIGAGLCWLFLSLFLARILPNVIIPLFYKYSRIENEELRQGILALFKKCNVKVQDVYVINLSSKTKKANAFVCGLGSKRRVVLGDTLLKDFSTPQIEAVVAHELGHYKHRDILKLTVVNSVMIFLAFYLIDKGLGLALSRVGGIRLDDIAGLPAFSLAFILFSLITTPALNAYSRLLETQADKFSLTLTGRVDDFIAMMEKLGAMNLAEFSPGWFDEMMFYDHPPIAKRIKFAQRFYGLKQEDKP